MSALVVLFPLFVVCVYAMVQAIQWRHDRQYALAIAQESAAAVALYHGDHNAVVADATSQLTRAGMGAVTVTVTGDAATVVVHVHADAPGILIGTTSDVDVAAAAPNERLTP